MIGVFTSEPYTHASISFDDTLSPMYSFARLGTLPLPGGIREEFVDGGYYKQHDHIPCALYALEVEDEVFDKAKAIATQMYENQSMYTYNVLGLMLCKMNIPYTRPNHFFCSEFVGSVLTQSKAMLLPKHPSLMRPTDYTKLDLDLRFKGQIRELAEYCARRSRKAKAAV